MPIYEYRCQQCGAVFSLLFRHASEAGEHIHCTMCDSDQTRRLISSFAVGGRANPGPGRAAWPTSWKATNGGDPETLRHWRHRIEQDARLEEKYPELRDPSLLKGGSESIPTLADHHDHHHHDHPHGSSS